MTIAGAFVFTGFVLTVPAIIFWGFFGNLWRGRADYYKGKRVLQGSFVLATFLAFVFTFAAVIFWIIGIWQTVGK